MQIGLVFLLRMKDSSRSVEVVINRGHSITSKKENSDAKAVTNDQFAIDLLIDLE